jgi:hypothetical protein
VQFLGKKGTLTEQLKSSVPCRQSSVLPLALPSIVAKQEVQKR